MNENIRVLNRNNYITFLPDDVVSHLKSNGTNCRVNGTVLSFRRQTFSHSTERTQGVSKLLASDAVFLNIYLALTTPSYIEQDERSFSEAGRMTRDTYRFVFDNFLDACGSKPLDDSPFWCTYTDTLVVFADFATKVFRLAKTGHLVCDARTVSYYFQYA